MTRRRRLMGGHVRLLSGMVLAIGLQMSVAGQDIPIETWRMHIAYNSIRSITFGDDAVYAAAENGIMRFDQSERSVTSINKLSGLTGSGISAIAYDNQSHQLLVGYDDGNLDIIHDNTVMNFDRLKNSTTIVGSKRINSIQVRSGLAYICADYGVVIFDLLRVEVKETWRDLGALGSTLKIFKSAFTADSIFLATEKGVIAGDWDTNLLDFSLWKRFDANAFSGPVVSVVVFNNAVYAAVNGAGVYQREAGQWLLQPYLQGASFQSLEATQSALVITESTRVWTLDASENLQPLLSPLITLPNTAAQDVNGKFWIGDSQSGLLADLTGAFTSVLPNGPADLPFRLNQFNNVLYAVPGGRSATNQPLRKSGTVSAFSSGIWQNMALAYTDITDFYVENETSSTLASFGYGVIQNNNGVTKVWDESNSPLTNLNPPDRFVNITAIEHGEPGLWVANFGSTTPLKLFKSDNTWQSFSLPSPARFVIDLHVDNYGLVWMIIDPAQGGGIVVFDYVENRSVYLTDSDNAGELPNRAVRSIVSDREGYVWVGTDEGVAYFPYPPDVFDQASAILPVFGQNFLLNDDKVTAIAVDGGNRKWMGTERGVWLFNPTGESQVYNFRADNSPLLSDVVLDIEVLPSNGEVFFATAEGLVSFRSGSSQGNPSFGEIKIFPNPVTHNFSGTVGITGLATDAIVKITDISGKLIWQTQANGGTATWNVCDYKGRRASTGVYLVFAATADGSERIVGKLAVVR